MNITDYLKRANQLSLQIERANVELNLIAETLELNQRTDDELERIARYSDGALRYRAVLELHKRGLIK